MLAFQQRAFKIAGTGFWEAAAEDGDEVLAAERLRHELPALTRFGVARESGFDQRRRIEFGFHGFRQEFDGLLSAAQARLFFFDFANGVVELIAGGVGKGVGEFLEALER